MRLQTKIISLQEKFFEKLKREAYAMLGPGSRQLKAYQREHTHLGERSFNIISQRRFFETLTQANPTLILVADFHTFEQNSKNYVRILKQLLATGQRPVLCFEFIMATAQKYLDAYLGHYITELEFLEAIDYYHSWRFPWNHYRQILECATEYHLPCYGINSKGSLSERDHSAAQWLREIRQNHPHQTILTLFGELHLLATKIPALLQQAEIPHYVIHQNIDGIYLKLNASKQRNAIVQLDETTFSVQTAPPWLKYESMIYWFENFLTDPDFDLHEYIIERGLQIAADDVGAKFQMITEQISKSFQLHDLLSKHELNNFEILDQSHFERIETRVQTLEPLALKNLYQTLLAQRFPFKIPQGETHKYYLHYYSINRLSFLAGLHLFHLTVARKFALDETHILQQSNDRRFFFYFQQAFIGHFAAKFMNPHQKCDLYVDYLTKHDQACSNSFEAKVYERVLTLIDCEKDDASTLQWHHIFNHLQMKTIYRIALEVGHYLAENLFEKLCKMDYETSIKFIKLHLFSKQFNGEHFCKMKHFILSGVDYQKKQKRHF